jgi:exodeoxyribonuclease III
VKIVTWNVNGIRARSGEVSALAVAEEPDVICLQEIKAAPDQIPDSLTMLPDYASFWHGARGGYSGVSVHLRRSTFPGPASFVHPSFDSETRIVEACLGDLVIASVYVPNGGKDLPAKITFLRAMIDHTRDELSRGKTLVICGDLNVAREDRDVHPKEQRPVIGQSPEERALFAELLGTGLVDVGRALSPEDDRMFSWWPYWREARQKNIGWRLDYVLAAPSMAARAKSVRVLRESGTSDHGAVVATFE